MLKVIECVLNRQHLKVSCWETGKSFLISETNLNQNTETALYVIIADETLRGLSGIALHVFIIISLSIIYPTPNWDCSNDDVTVQKLNFKGHERHLYWKTWKKQTTQFFLGEMKKKGKCDVKTFFRYYIVTIYMWFNLS